MLLHLPKKNQLNTSVKVQKGGGDICSYWPHQIWSILQVFGSPITISEPTKNWRFTLKFAFKITLKRKIFYVFTIYESRFSVFGSLVTNFGVLSTRNRRLALKFAKTISNIGIFDEFMFILCFCKLKVG